MIRKGTVVRLKVGTRGVGSGRRGKAVVLARLATAGGVLLDRHLGGFRYWNVDDLERAWDPKAHNPVQWKEHQYRLKEYKYVDEQVRRVKAAMRRRNKR